MAEDEKVKIYSPETIIDQALPGQEIGSVVSEKSYSPEEISDNPIPQTVVATEVQGVVRSATGNKVIDELGLVSSENFIYGSIYLDQPADFTNTGWTDIPNTSQTFTLKRNASVLFLVNIRGNTNAGTADVRMTITGLTQGNIVPILTIRSTGTYPPYEIHRIFEVPAADPVTFKLQGIIYSPATALQFGGGYITSTFLVMGK